MTPLKYVHLCTQYLARAPLAQMTTSVRCGMEALSLWHCWVAIEPSARQDCWIDCISSFSWKYPIYSIWGSGQAYCLGQSSTLISWSANHLEVVLTLWADTKVLLENEISISIKLVSRWNQKVLQNLLVYGCIDFGLDKTVDQHQQTSQHPKSSQTVETSHCSHFRQCFCFRSGLVALFLKTSERGDSWCTDSSFSSLLVKLSQVFESALLDPLCGGCLRLSSGPLPNQSSPLLWFQRTIDTGI